MSLKHSKEGRLRVQTGFEGCILFSSTKSCILKTCAVSLVREALQVSLPLFCTSSRTKNYDKTTQNSSISVASVEHTNIVYLDDMLLIGHTIEETLMVRDTVISLLQQLRFVLNLKKSVLTPTQRIEFLGVTVDSLIMTLSLPEKKISKVQKQCQKLNKTNRLIVFNYSSSISSINKF